MANADGKGKATANLLKVKSKRNEKKPRWAWPKISAFVGPGYQPKTGFVSIFEYYLGSSVYVSSPYITIRVWMNSQLSSGSSELKRVEKKEKKSGLVFSCRMDPSKRGWGLTFYRPFSGLATDSIFSQFALCRESSICMEGKSMTTCVLGENKLTFSFLPAAPSSQSQTLEVLFDLTWRP